MSPEILKNAIPATEMPIVSVPTLPGKKLQATHVPKVREAMVAQARFAFPMHQLSIVRTKVMTALEAVRGLRSIEADDSVLPGTIDLYAKDDHMVLAADTSYGDVAHVTKAMQDAGVDIELTFEQHND